MLDELLKVYHNTYKKILDEFGVSHFNGNMYDMSSYYWIVLDKYIYWGKEIPVDIKTVQNSTCGGILIDDVYIQSRCGGYVAIEFEEHGEYKITGIFTKGKMLNG